MTPPYLTDATAFINTWLGHYFPYLNQPSLSLAIAHNGVPVFTKAWGFANLEAHEAATPNHIYRVASHSKSFTAFLVLMLVEEGILSLDAPLSTYLPWLAPNTTYAPLTLRNILSHSSGNTQDGSHADIWNVTVPFPTKAEMKDYLLNATPVLTPNTQVKYSNYAYTLAAFAMEEAAGESYEALLQRKIIQPLNLTHTGPDNPPADKPVATGYSTPIDGIHHPISPFQAANGLVSAAGIHSTPIDLCTVFHAFINDNLLSPQSRLQLTSPVWNGPTQSYCLGLVKYTFKGHDYFGHGGGYTGFVTRTMTCPELGVTISLGTNSYNAISLTLCQSLFDILWFFKTQRGENNPLSKYESPFYHLESIAHTLAGTNILQLANLSSANPIENAVGLTPTDTSGNFLITGTDGYGYLNESASIVLENGKPTHMHYASGTHTASKAEHLRHLKTLAPKSS